MKMTDALLGEHGVLYALFDHIERVLPELDTLNDVQLVASVFGAALVSHARIEDDMLFPALDPHLGQVGPLTVMRNEHSQIEQSLERISMATDVAVAAKALSDGLTLARSHFSKEEKVLFHLARQVLSGEELEQLGASWADVRRVAIE